MVVLNDEGVFKKGDVVAHEQFIFNEQIPDVTLSSGKAPTIDKEDGFYVITIQKA